MPIYEYQCPKCHTVFEEWLRSVDESDKPCPKCATLSPHIVSKTSFALKGDGWYVTEYGYKKEEAAPAEKVNNAEASTPPEGDATTTDADTAKAETKAEAPAKAESPQESKPDTKTAPVEKATPKTETA